MSTKAESVWAGFRELPPQEQQEVFQYMTRWLAQAAKPQPAGDPIRSARGMFAGGGLNELLLTTRAEERQRG
jgi:hypothetical protein